MSKSQQEREEAPANSSNRGSTGGSTVRSGNTPDVEASGAREFGLIPHRIEEHLGEMSGCGLSFKVSPEKLSNTWPPCGSSGTNPPVTLRVLPSMPADAFSTCKPPDRNKTTLSLP